MSTEQNLIFDAAIIGGGPAGMSAALSLARANKQVVLFDDSRPRNAVTRHTHGFLTRDGVTPGEFRRIARAELANYPNITIYEEHVVWAGGEDGAFQLTAASGTTLSSRKLLFAVGLKDRPLFISGLQDVYGHSAFVCPFCDGWELRGQPLVVINKGPELLHFLPILSGWSKQLTVCTNGEDGLSEEERQTLAARDIIVHQAPIASIESQEGKVQQVLLEDGTIVPCSGIFFKPDLMLGSTLPRELGCQMTDTGTVVVDQTGKTSVPGVFSAGDAASQLQQTIAAAQTGALAAAMITSELNMAEWEQRGGA